MMGDFGVAFENFLGLAMQLHAGAAGCATYCPRNEGHLRICQREGLFIVNKREALIYLISDWDWYDRTKAGGTTNKKMMPKLRRDNLPTKSTPVSAQTHKLLLCYEGIPGCGVHQHCHHPNLKKLPRLLTIHPPLFYFWI
jgi:hypothetical protein